MKKYLVATDLDGTVSFLQTNENGQQESYIKDADKKAIQILKKDGHIVSISTGRDISGIKAFLDLGGISFDYYIGGNGSIITDKDFNVLYKESFDNSLTISFLEYLDTHFPEFHITGYDGYTTYSINHDGAKAIFDIEPQHFATRTIGELKQDPVHFIAIDIFPKDGTHEDKLHISKSAEKEINQKFSKKISIFRNQYYVDFAPLGISKGSAVERLASIIQEDDLHVVTIGDSWNDLSMFQISDTSFTFTYADDALQKEADHVVNSFAEMVETL